jgi:tetratricopeptide (TPR) repeat protein
MINQSEKIRHGELEVLQAKKSIAEQEKDDETVLAVLERLIEINPGNTDARFSLAYKYSEVGQDNLAAFHYSRIPPAERNASAWNNLGVSFERLGLPIKSVAAYKKSESLGETLAMSNLAIRLRDAGFSEEAKTTIHAALKVENHHKNVETTLSSISNALETEDKKEIETNEKSKLISEFYRQYGRSLVKTTAVDFTGKWKSPNCTLEFSVDGTSVIATGWYEVLGLSSIVNPYTNEKPEPLQQTEIYTCVIHGMTIVGSVQRKKKDDASKSFATLLGNAATSSSVLMWVSHSADKIHVLERNAKNEPKLYEITRI